MKLNRTIWLVPLTIAASAILPATAMAEEKTCRGTIGSVTHDNIRVPQGATCTLNGTTAKGTVKVERGATLRANGVRVIGNVQGENAHRVNIVEDSTVGGSVQVVQGNAARVVNSRVNADILYDDNSAYLEILRNRVGGNVQAFQNTGGVKISRNVIDGNLQCKENSPRPVGDSNVAQGNKEDQCARL
jgi:hypothetical protein